MPEDRSRFINLTHWFMTAVDFGTEASDTFSSKTVFFSFFFELAALVARFARGRGYNDLLTRSARSTIPYTRDMPLRAEWYTERAKLVSKPLSPDPERSEQRAQRVKQKERKKNDTVRDL